MTSTHETPMSLFSHNKCGKITIKHCELDFFILHFTYLEGSAYAPNAPPAYRPAQLTVVHSKYWGSWLWLPVSPPSIAAADEAGSTTRSSRSLATCCTSGVGVASCVISVEQSVAASMINSTRLSHQFMTMHTARQLGVSAVRPTVTPRRLQTAAASAHV